MIRQLWFGYMNMVDRLEGERWYFRYHGREFARWFGPWMRRYETYRALDPPLEAEPFGALAGMYTEMWWPSIEAYQEAGPFGRPYTVASWRASLPPGGMVAAVPMTPAKPTEDFLGKEPNPEEKILRWIRVFRYPDGVSQQEGDAWYLNTHSQEVKRQPDLLRYISYRTLDEPPPRATEGPYGPWHRVDELWYPNLAAWREAAVGSPPGYTAPPWSSELPFVEMVSDFVRIRPDVDFLKDNPLVP